MRWLPRIVLALLSLVVGLLALLLAASYVFDFATNGEGQPVSQLWHGPFVTADGVRTAYREWGSHGSPIVLVGGFLEPTFVWGGVGPRLARAGHRVYALDLDGFGYTQRHGPWNLQGWAGQTRGFIRALGLRNPLVVGHSLGAAVAVDLARHGFVSRIVLLDGDARPGGGPSGFLGDLIARSPLLTSALRLSLAWDWPVRQVLANAYAPAHPKVDHALVERWTDQLRAKKADRAITAVVEHGVPGFSEAQLRAVRARVTVVWGDEDGVDPMSAGRRTARDLHARFVGIAHAGHLALLTRPAAVAQAIETGVS